MTTMTYLLPTDAMRRQRGQTLVIALIMLGILLILGFVFLGIINRSIQTAGRMQNRSLASDLAEAGVRYAHVQLQQSEQGADWRGGITPMVDASARGDDLSVDPDALYIRPPASDTNGARLRLRSESDPQLDMGGPDGLGPFIRVNFEQGRALVRVRFAPSDANLFSSDPTGPLRNPGAARNYTIIESIGRPGRVVFNDPTTLSGTLARRYRNFASAAEFRTELGLMRRQDAKQVTSRRLIAFVSIGIIETARFITNLNRVTRAAEIGVPRELGVSYDNLPVEPPLLMGSTLSIYNRRGELTTGVQGFGSFHSNADLTIHGNMMVSLNATLGDAFTVAGNLIGADNTATLEIQRRDMNLRRGDANEGRWNPAQTYTLTGTTLDSRSNAFSTALGVVRDAVSGTDADGFPRGIGYKTPPSILTADPETGALRYVAMTRESGVRLGNGNTVGLGTDAACTWTTRRTGRSYGRDGSGDGGDRGVPRLRLAEPG
jgi:hypothetical protein